MVTSIEERGTLAGVAHEMREYLQQKFLPYWYATQDMRNGGYKLADRHLGPWHTLRTWRSRGRFIARNFFHVDNVRARDKRIVGQARLVWVFSHVHRFGFSDETRDYLKAAELGYRFLTEHMLDSQYGGYHWLVDLKGRVLDSRKILYGQCFALYALVEYHRASGLAAPLEQAISLYRTVEEHLHDGIYGGWIEHAERDFTWLGGSIPHKIKGLPDVVGIKSVDGHMHWMEALTELYAVTGDKQVETSLREALDIVSNRFYPLVAERRREFLSRDWSTPENPEFDAFYYGHCIEAGWLMVHTQQVLGIPPAWDHLYDIIDRCLEVGFDYETGGFEGGACNPPLAKDERIWWIQGEGLAALTTALCQGHNPHYAHVLGLLLSWIFRYQVMPDDGVWLGSTDGEGRHLDRTKAANWKAAYHETRAMMMFINAFSQPIRL